jgi:DNA replication protein DnaC
MKISVVQHIISELYPLQITLKQTNMNEVNKELQKLKLAGMARLWSSLNETRSLDKLTLTDGITLLLQAEHDSRTASRNQRLIKNADFRYSATLEQIQSDAQRGIDPNMLALLATGGYIQKGESILITGAAGVGKSYLATALGNRACYQGYKVIYYSMQKLLTKLRLARMEGTAVKMLLKIQKTDLLIIDDFGMKTLEGQQQNDFMEIIEDRHAQKATIIASQLPVSKWYDVIGNEMIADAILDRLVHTAHRFDLKGESLRKK